MRKFMFDGNAFSSLLSSEIDWVTFFSKYKEDYEFFITSIQIEELAKIPDQHLEKRIGPLLCLCAMNVKLVPTIAVVGHARLNMCVLANGEDMYSKLLNTTHSNVCDAMIGDAAYREGCILVTNDTRFIAKLKKNQVPTMTFQEFCKFIDLEV